MLSSGVSGQGLILNPKPLAIAMGFLNGVCIGCTLPETNMDTQKGPYKDYSPSKRGLYGFPC